MKTEELFGIDLRSLALFRVGLGLLILGDVFLRSFDLQAFYTDAGVLPRATLLGNPSFFWPVSLNMLHGSAPFQVLLFLLTALSALALLLGYRTRLATFATWLLLTSLHARNPFVNQAGDTLLHLYLFWALFLPMGAYCSLDRRIDPSAEPRGDRVFSGGSTALILQICLVYWFAAINKTGPLWRDGSALYFVFSVEELAKPLGVFLLEYPRILKTLTRFTIWLESLGPLLAFVPVATGFFRTLAVFLFLCFHLGMALSMKLGTFPYICMLGWLVFLPGAFWNRIASLRLARLPPLKSSWATNALALLAFTYILLINLAFTGIDKFRPVFIQKYRWIGKLFSIDQSWAMFSPDPLLKNWRYVIPGTLEDGSKVELQAAKIPNVKWRKYFNWMPNEEFAFLLPHYGNYLCRTWNSQSHKGAKLKSLQIYYVHESVLPNFQKAPAQQDLLWEQPCGP